MDEDWSIRVLLIEDDFDVAEGLSEYLETHEVEVDFSYSLGDARRCLSETDPDIILLDVELPDGDGIAFCRAIADEGHLPAPVLFLTARSHLDDRLAGFAAGGLDYIVKPFEPAELLARIRAALRRTATKRLDDRLDAGEYALNRTTGLLRRADREMHLQKSGLRIIGALMEASPGTVGRERLNALLWGDDTPDSDPLRAHIHALRRALKEALGSDPIRTVRGLGYRWQGDA
ncbi:response regulator transcription factor [Altererythrobacter arenosus]|uniref:Response regulator transcription factor n=1 Tax=Altererythrobacter arenosus TaxID=3032592 RepID=A0ABY8FS12_9SPHN|nr:response regulator transcription factor [Altererythrobacter sp. CAU 1644]WFL77790.1 response regulator transcription factor [Altererythrobacter sp. CAU 1644]